MEELFTASLKLSAVGGGGLSVVVLVIFFAYLVVVGSILPGKLVPGVTLLGLLALLLLVEILEAGSKMNFLSPTSDEKHNSLAVIQYPRNKAYQNPHGPYLRNKDKLKILTNIHDDLDFQFHLAIHQLPHNARGMEVVGAMDSYCVGEDIGNVSSLFLPMSVCDMEETLEIPIMNHLTMVLGSISHVTFQFQHLSKFTLIKHSLFMQYFFDLDEFHQSKETGVVATTFGLKSVVYVPRIKVDTVSALSAFLRESQHGEGSSILSTDAIQIVNNLSNLGQIYNIEGLSTNVLARRQVVGEDGVCVHSMVLPGLPSSTTIYFS
ncbi:hypothetical protein GQ457_04G012840 [Hibiscus cannabinus]